MNVAKCVRILIDFGLKLDRANLPNDADKCFNAANRLSNCLQEKRILQNEIDVRRIARELWRIEAFRMEKGLKLETALWSALKALNHLVKKANQNGRPTKLIVKTLQAKMRLDRELRTLRGEV